MRNVKTYPGIIVLVFTVVMMACNEPSATVQQPEIDSLPVETNNAASLMPAYDPALEPLTVGARFSKLLHDTLGIKMYEFTLPPGDSAALHAHPDHVVYVLQGGKALISLNGAAPQIMELQTGMGFISPSVKDYGKNIGTTTIKLLITDIYRPRGK